ncbi:MAG: hypothetical protein AAB431_01310 [Patescibacteria group bacterium]
MKSIYWPKRIFQIAMFCAIVLLFPVFFKSGQAGPVPDGEKSLIILWVLIMVSSPIYIPWIWRLFERNGGRQPKISRVMLLLSYPMFIFGNAMVIQAMVAHINTFPETGIRFFGGFLWWAGLLWVSALAIDCLWQFKVLFDRPIPLTDDETPFAWNPITSPGDEEYRPVFCDNCQSRQGRLETSGLCHDCGVRVTFVRSGPVLHVLKVLDS